MPATSQALEHVSIAGLIAVLSLGIWGYVQLRRARLRHRDRGEHKKSLALYRRETVVATLLGIPTGIALIWVTTWFLN